MASNKHPNFIRYAGNLEKVSTARHALGLLYPVAFTVRYYIAKFASSSGDLLPLLYAALQVVLAQHPALNCGIVDEDLQDPAFIRLNKIDLRECVTVKEDTRDLSSWNEKVLEDVLSDQHSHSWSNLSTLPTWRLLVIPHPNNKNAPSQQTIDLCFVFHHALIDGLSGSAFHHSLLKALNDPSLPPCTSPVIEVPQSVRLQPPVEEHLELKVTYRRLLSEALAAYVPPWLHGPFRFTRPPWTGSPALVPISSPFVTRLRVLDISASRFRDILAYCRKENTTLTAVLHGIIVLCLSHQIPNAQAFVATTPYSVRGYVGTSSDEIINQISVVSTTYSRNLIESIQRPGAQPDVSTVTTIGDKFLRDLRESRAAFPVDNMLSLLQYLQNMQSFFRNQLGKDRAATFEVSNTGIHRQGRTEKVYSNQSLWQVGRALFTQGGSVIGHALGFNVASVEDGPLTVSLTWQDGAVETSLAETLLQHVEERLDNLSIAQRSRLVTKC